MNVLLLFMIPLLVSGPWEAIGPEGGEVTAILQSTQNTDLLYAVSGSNPTQVVRSLDGGFSWEAISYFTSFGTPYDMVMTSTGKLVAVGPGRTWVSADDGFTWNTYGQAGKYFYDAVAHPTNGDEIYATGYTYDGSWDMTFLHSTDGGATWSDMPLVTSGNNSYGRCIAVSTQNPSNILIGGYENDRGYIPDLFLSTNGGTSFSNVTPAAASGENYIYGAAIHPVNADILIAGSITGIYQSTDGGSSWSRIRNQYFNFDISFSDADPNFVIASGSYDKTYISTDCGASWSTTTAGIEGDDIKWMETDALNSSIAYTGSTLGFFRSSDGGSSWTMQNSGLLLGNVMAMEFLNGYIFMNMENMVAVFRTEEGSTVFWEEVIIPLACGDFCSIESNDVDTLLAFEGVG